MTKDAVPEEVAALGERLRNWGRWGDDDERGTTNLITPEAIVRAAGLIRRGVIFDLGIPLDENGPQLGGPRSNPTRLMSETGHDQEFPGGFRFSDDFVFMPLQAGTQWDSLAHVFYDDQPWNGYPASEVTSWGAKRNSITSQAAGIAGRAVLVDVARHRGVDVMGPSEPITADDLDAVLAAQGAAAGPGDILLVRTGWYGKFAQDRDRVAFMDTEPGLDLSCATWLREHDIAAVAADNWGVEVFRGYGAGRMLELHQVLIRNVGMTLGEMFDLDALAADCAADGVWDCFLAAPPLKFTGAVGSPLNPLAFK
jgi:kynurenine formamidase